MLVASGAFGLNRHLRKKAQVYRSERASAQPVKSASAANPTPKPGAVGKELNLDQEVQAGFAALKNKDPQTAQKHFENALKVFDAKPSASKWLSMKLSLSPSNSVVTVNGQPKDVSDQVDSYRQVMGTHQALLEFAAFSAQLAKDSRTADIYVNKVEDMRGVMWGKSWLELIPQIHRVFFPYVTPDDSEAFGKYLLMAGRLLLDADNSGAIELIRRAKHNLPKDATVPALIASYLINNHDANGAKSEALDSLALDPNQASVLIDLATAEWLLGELEPASKAAHKAMEIDPTLPGPHATLAFVALETGDPAEALKHAELGNQLSDGHPFFKTILAVSCLASGNSQRAQKLMTEAWKDDYPDEKKLASWFFRSKPLEYARSLIKRGE